MLIQWWNMEIRKDHRDRNDIVQAERFFDHITCKEVHCRSPSIQLVLGQIQPEPAVLIGKINEHIEGERDTDPHTAQQQRLLQRDGVSLAVEGPEVKHEQEKNEFNEHRPQATF